ncbi:MAG: hypothetical protein RLY86_3531 [Pseudomonadota bacterium]|jgi:hypothetical protein
MADTIKTGMPLLARHAGEWEGVYTHVDTDNVVIDRHRSHLTCTFPEDGPYAYMQVNRYAWDDGRTEVNEFPATYRDGRIWWDTPRITGYAWEVDPRTICLYWQRKDMEGWYLYEMIQLSACGTKRGRTWHWFENDELVRRTCIKETRIA